VTAIVAAHLPSQETGNAVEKVYDGGEVTARPPTTLTQPGGDPALYDVLSHATATVSKYGFSVWAGGATAVPFASTLVDAVWYASEGAVRVCEGGR
jgi:hypothetical protein